MYWGWIFLPKTGFFGKTQDFSANSSKHAGIFHGTSDTTSSTSDRDLFYPRNVPILFTTRRFGGVGAPEGRKKCLTTFFCKLKKMCFWRKIMESTRFLCNIVFLAEDYGWMPTEFFCKICEHGVANL
jgi:hypothetical protein